MHLHYVVNRSSNNPKGQDSQIFNQKLIKHKTKQKKEDSVTSAWYRLSLHQLSVPCLNCGLRLSISVIGLGEKQK